MKIGPGPFNIYYSLALALALLAGCQTPEERERSKEMSTLRLHLEVNPDGTDRSGPVPVFRENPVLVNVERNPFLHEGDIAKALVADVLGGYVIQVQFDTHGVLALDTVTAAHKGRRVAVFSEFGPVRWLAAPVMNKRIRDGLLTFTPDASHEEAERIVRGLNNVVAKNRKKTSL
jgi:hypothetical protein